MSMTPLKRRMTAVVAALGGAALAFAGFALGTDGSPPETAESSAPDSGAYPVTVEGHFADVTVTEKPERIVVLGWASVVDSLAALGEPVAAFGSSQDEAGALTFTPWLEGLYGEYDADLYTEGFEPVAEAVAAQEPDLIVINHWALEEASYDQLATVAPTFVLPNIDDYSWESRLRDLAALTDTTERAEQVIADTEAEFAEARERLSGLQGKTFSAGLALADGSGVYIRTAVADWILPLGLEPAESQPVPPEPVVTISPENLEQLDGDVFFLLGNTEQRAPYEDDPRFSDLPSVTNGAYFPFQDLVGEAIETQVGPHAISWLLERVVPALEESPLNRDS